MDNIKQHCNSVT